jgi:hypothetical protein
MRLGRVHNSVWAYALPFVVQRENHHEHRLFWNGHHGALRSGPHTRQLSETPKLPGSDTLNVEEIDYAPEVNVAQLRVAGEDWREMSEAEVAGAETLLAMLATTNEAMPLAQAA